MDNVINVLALSQEQHEWMLSLKALKVRADADAEKNDKKSAAKIRWLNKWLEIERNEFKETFSDTFHYYGSTVDLMERTRKLVQDSGSKTWYYLAIMEAELFDPYYPLYGKDAKEDKEFKGLKFSQKDYVKTFVTMDGQVASTFIDRVNKTYSQAIARMDGRYSKIASRDSTNAISHLTQRNPLYNRRGCICGKCFENIITAGFREHRWHQFNAMERICMGRIVSVAGSKTRYVGRNCVGKS